MVFLADHRSLYLIPADCKSAGTIAKVVRAFRRLLSIVFFTRVVLAIRTNKANVPADLRSAGIKYKDL